MSVLVGFGSFSSSVSVWSNKVGAIVVLVENTAMPGFSSDKLSGVSTQTSCARFVRFADFLWNTDDRVFVK